MTQKTKIVGCDNIPYEGLDATGRPVIRPARLIGELPYELRRAACEAAAQAVGEYLGIAPRQALPFGAPVFEAFGLTRPDAKKHAAAALLLTHGHCVPLRWCAAQLYEVRHTLDGATGVFEITAMSVEDAIEQVKRQLVFVDGDWLAKRITENIDGLH